MPQDNPTVLVSRYRTDATTKANDNSYKGHRIHALPGLHDFLASKALEYFRPGASMLDLAAGSGALSLRMHDLGYKVTATDYVSENFKLDCVPFKQCDLNSDFSASYAEGFQAIIASEIIEHLENPRHFARECFKLVEPGGRLLLSTPNVENPGSKASFLRSGMFLWFTEADYEGQGHITPLTQWQMHKAFTEAGFVFKWKGSFGEGASRVSGSPRLQWLSKIVALLSATDPLLSKEIFVAALEKPLS